MPLMPVDQRFGLRDNRGILDRDRLRRRSRLLEIAESCQRPRFYRFAAADMSSANTARSPSSPKKMHARFAICQRIYSVRPQRPSRVVPVGLSGLEVRNGSSRQIGNISEVGSCRLDSIQFASVRFSLARFRGLPAKGIIQFSKELYALQPRACAAFHARCPADCNINRLSPLCGSTRVTVGQTVC